MDYLFKKNSVKCLEKKLAGRLMEVKNHTNNTLVAAKGWPWPLNTGGR